MPTALFGFGQFSFRYLHGLRTHGKQTEYVRERNRIKISMESSMKEKQTGIKRDANFELLRIVAMIMIVSLHYWGKSNYLDNVTVGTPGFYLAWFIESCCIPAVNCYVLLTGYFMCEKKFKPGRVIRIWLQVLEYSVIIYFVCCGFGLDSFSGPGLLKSFLPVTNETYWFATKYLLLLFVSPFLNLLLEKCNRVRLTVLCVCLFTLFSLLPSVFYLKDWLDISGGYSLLWFVCLYVFGAAVRKTDYSYLRSKGKCLGGYFASVFLIFAVKTILGLVVYRTGEDISYARVLYQYNFVLTLSAAVFLFGFFKNLKIHSKAAGRIVMFLSPATFGVYLLHLNVYSTKWFFRSILHPEKISNVWLLFVQYLVVVLAVYLLCTMVEKIRLILLENNPLMRKVFEGADRLYEKILKKMLSREEADGKDAS